MLDNARIKNANRLEFAVFCIENIAIRLEKNAEDIFKALTEQSNILSGYIIPEHEMLHTQSKDSIVNEIIAVMKERNIVLSASQRRKTNITASPILLQKKYTRIIELFAKKENLSLDDALSFFYHSEIYRLISEGVSDLHCMSDEYLTEELISEYKEK